MNQVSTTTFATSEHFFRAIRSAKEECPPVKHNNGFSPFAFLAFILISVNTVMNIANNISNNNNNRNNNNNDNNNNNLFNSINVNMAMKRRRRFTEEDDLVEALRNKSLDPWSAEFFRYLRSKYDGKATVMMHQWMTSVTTAYPACLLALPCTLFKSQEDCWKQECPLI